MHELIAKKVANALMMHATPKKSVGEWVGRIAGEDAQKEFSDLPKKHGGLWVGGNISLYTDKLCFEPNALNRILQDEVFNIDIPLEAIDRGTWRFGFVTGIITIVWMKDGAQHVSTFRCYRAKTFLAKILSTAQTSKVVDVVKG